jgi:hypothetical protein
MLVSAVDEDLKTGRLVRHANCGVRLVLVLPAFSVAPLRCYIDIRLGNLNILDLRNWKNPNYYGRSLSSSVLLGRRNALNAVLSAFASECRPSVWSYDLRREMSIG